MSTLSQRRKFIGPLSRWEIIALALVALFLVSVLYPVYGYHYFVPRIFVYDANGTPVPFARLSFKSANRGLNYFTITDRKGESRDHIAYQLAETVSGPYKFQTIEWNSKSPKIWVISTRGTLTYSVRDAEGHPMPNFPIYLLRPPGGLYQKHFRSVRPSESLTNKIFHTDQNGTVSFPGVALAQRPEPYAGDERYAVKSINVTTGKDWVHYEVHLAKSATVTGIVTSATGIPIVDATVSVSITSDHRYRIKHNILDLTSTDTYGRFRKTGLPPGNYTVGLRRLPRSADDESLPSKQITVKSGETKPVSLSVP